jgi:hypothetical protein
MDRLRRIGIRNDSIKKNQRYYKNIEYPKISIDSDDIYILSRVGDRLDSMAYDFYKDTTLWWIISKANPDKISRDSFFINPGMQLRIPQNIEKIIEDFEKLNG